MSALADGELLHQEWAAMLQACGHDPAASGHWDTYHVIGEALRRPGSAVQLTDASFLTRLNRQLAKQPGVGPELQTTMPMQMPMPYLGVVCDPVPTTAADDRQKPASNDSHFRWKRVAGFACAAVVCVVAWNASVSMLPAAGPQLAQSGTLTGGTEPQQVVVASPQGLMVRDARLEELLTAHKQLGTTSAWPVPSGFLRHATFETPQNPGR
ncbi:MAG: anti-sigma factor [Polaromonas sp.]|nr:MAG: anti-sigma factor [Polaromonas sp.]